MIDHCKNRCNELIIADRHGRLFNRDRNKISHVFLRPFSQEVLLWLHILQTLLRDVFVNLLPEIIVPHSLSLTGMIHLNESFCSLKYE